MKITFLDHSGFLVELDQHVLLFDYYKGEIPDIPGKFWIVFSSHFHEDHYNPAVFELRDRYEDVRYILSNDIYRYRKRTIRGDCERVRPEMTYEYDDFKLETYRSTDSGCAYFVEIEGRSIYHAGDLHWWHWIGEPDADNTYMEREFKKQIGRLSVHEVDVAFMLLDPRQEDAYDLGMTYFLANVHASHVFPMHQWQDYEITKKYLGSPDGQRYGGNLIAIEHSGQEFEIE